MKYLADVYLLNARALAEELSAGTLSEYRALKHFIVAAIIGGASFYFPVGLEYAETQINFFNNFAEFILYFIVLGIISYFGIWLCFQANSKGDGRDFFLRMAVLTLPVMIRVWIFALIIGVPLMVLSIVLITMLFEDIASGLVLLTEVTIDIVFTIVYFIVLNKYVRIAAGDAGENVT